MAVALPNNEMVDIYRFGGSPPAQPATANVPVTIIPRFRNIKTVASGFVYTHILLFPMNVDVRDNYPAGGQQGDDLFVHGAAAGVHYNVSFVERHRTNGGADIKRVFAVLTNPANSWPSSNF